MNILSLFDGVSTGMLAMRDAGVEVDNYYAYEIDTAPIKCSKAVWGDKVTQCGDVFKADFAQYKGKIDFLLSGFVCTFFSCAQKKNREVVAETGPGWDLFMQTIRAMNESQPKYILFENVASMTKEMMKAISEKVGFEPVMINSALVSAQVRKRYYWVGKRNPDGTYSKINVEQPEDKHVLLKDILESGFVDRDKAYCLKHQLGNARDYFVKNHTQIAFEPVTAYGVGYRNRREDDGKLYRRFETHAEEKANCLTSVATDSMVCIQVGALPRPNGELSTSQAFRIYSIDGKSVTLKANGGGCGGKTGMYAVPLSEDEAKELTDRQVSRIYEVTDHKIWIKGKQYPIKLDDGLYWIRPLSVVECCRLQTMPDDYCNSLTKTAAQKALGNGWTKEVIVHLIKSVMIDESWCDNAH